MKLFEIDNAILDCIDLETGEIIDIDKLNALQMERDAKVESVALWIKELKYEADALKNEKMVLAERQRVAENKVESLKKFLQHALNGQKFKTAKASVSFRHSESVEVEDIDKLDDAFKKVKYDADKTAIKQAINDGHNVAGAYIKDGLSVIVK